MSPKTTECKSFGEAIGKALDWLREENVQLEEPFEARMGGFGMQSRDGKGGYRIEFDTTHRAHINVWSHSRKGPHFEFPGNKNVVKSIQRQLFYWDPKLKRRPPVSTLGAGRKGQRGFVHAPLMGALAGLGLGLLAAWIRNRQITEEVERSLAALEPEIDRRLQAQSDELIDLQLKAVEAERTPELFANITVALRFLHQRELEPGGPVDWMVFMESEPRAVSISGTEKSEMHNEYGNWQAFGTTREETEAVTYSVPLRPLPSNELLDVIDRRIQQNEDELQQTDDPRLVQRLQADRDRLLRIRKKLAQPTPRNEPTLPPPPSEPTRSKPLPPPPAHAGRLATPFDPGLQATWSTLQAQAQAQMAAQRAQQAQARQAQTAAQQAQQAQAQQVQMTQQAIRLQQTYARQQAIKLHHLQPRAPARPVVSPSQTFVPPVFIPPPRPAVTPQPRPATPVPSPNPAGGGGPVIKPPPGLNYGGIVNIPGWNIPKPSPTPPPSPAVRPVQPMQPCITYSKQQGFRMPMPCN